MEHYLDFCSQNVVSLFLFFAFILGIIGSLIQIPRLKNLESDEDRVHPTELAHIQEVRFIKKVVPHAISASEGGGYHAKECWLPEFHYRYRYGDHSYENSWSSPARRVEEANGFEVIALFGNKNVPTENFKNIWSGYAGKSVPIIVDKDDPRISQLLLGMKTTQKEIVAMEKGIRVCSFLMIFPLLWLILRLISFEMSWTSYRWKELRGARLERPFASLELTFDHVTDSGTNPFMLRTYLRENKVYLTLYKNPAIPILEWFSRDREVGEGFSDHEARLDLSRKRWVVEADMYIRPETEYFYQSGSETIKLELP